MKTRKDRFIEKADHLLGWIDRELSMEPPARPSAVETSDLEIASKYVKEMKHHVNKDTLPPKGLRYHVLGRIIDDQWPWRCELGNEISELEDFYTQL